MHAYRLVAENAFPKDLEPAEVGAGTLSRERLVQALTVGLSVTEDVDSPEELVALFEEAESGGSTQALSEDDAAALVEFAGLEPAVTTALLEPQVAAAATVRARREGAQQTLASTVTAAEVARMVSRDRSVVSRWAGKGQLYRFQVRGVDRYPRWQFIDGEPLPGLGEVVPAIPAGMVPSAVETFMGTEFEELAGLTPHDWLRAGNPAAAVARLLSELDR
ncbi:hypothetical protein BI335_13705 [Enemella evansiae]|nr:hypothetical protein BI335_13705 [Enemella evansiae]TDO88160.1 hypothetical protein C8D81_3241 [Enemella evansiae]